MKIRKFLVAIASFTVAASVLALPPDGGDPPPPPPPKELNDCSPGFWKNHEEYWANGQYCSDQTCVDDVLSRLQAKGPGSGDIRQNMANSLNAFADSYYGALICTD